MNSGRANGSATSKHTTPKPSVEELTELVRDLYELLQGYAPWWFTKDMDTRVSETLARFTPAKKISARQHKSERPGFFAALRKASFSEIDR